MLPRKKKIIHINENTFLISIVILKEIKILFYVFILIMLHLRRETIEDI